MSINTQRSHHLSNCLRLRGLQAGRCLVQARDLRGGEERIQLVSDIVPDVLDPNDFFSLRQALDFCDALFGYFPPPAENRSSDSHWRDLERTIRRAVEAGEVVLISEHKRPYGRYKVTSAPIQRAGGPAWPVYGVEGNFLIVRRTCLLPGERPVQGPEVREVIESLLAPESQLSAAAVLKSLQNAGAGMESHAGGHSGRAPKGSPGAPVSTADLRSHLDSAFRSGTLVLVALKRDAGGIVPSGEAADESLADRPLAAPTKSHWIEFRVIDVTTGEAVPGIQLDITLADASKQQGKTDAAGAIRFDDTTPGTCAIRSCWKNIRLEDAYSFVAVE